MKRKLFYISYFLLMVLVVFWLGISNQIVSSSGKYQSVQACRLSDYPQKDPVHYAIDVVRSLGGLQETVTIWGWAFSETVIDNSEFSTALILANDTHCYELAFENPTDDYTYAAYIKRDDVVLGYPDSQLYSDRIGFIGDFSTLNIKQGTYDAYIYRRENEENYGLVRTGKQFVKKGAQLEMRDWAATSQASLRGETVGRGTPSSLDIAAIENNTLVLKGWILAEGQDCDAQAVYIHLQCDGVDTYYNAQSMARLDVAKGYGNPLYNMSGFNTAIALDGLPQGDLNITLLTQLDGQLWQGASYTLTRDGNTVVINR